MKHPNAVSLAKRLLDSRLRRQALAGMESDPPERADRADRADQIPDQPDHIDEETIAWAQDILATHLDACMRQGIHPDLSEAVEEALDFAMRREKAYEPIPEGARWQFALVVMEEQDAD